MAAILSQGRWVNISIVCVWPNLSLSKWVTHWSLNKMVNTLQMTYWNVSFWKIFYFGSYFTEICPQGSTNSMTALA